MQLAVIPPVPMVDKMSQQNIHLCLSHLVLANPGYAEYYYKRSNAGDHVILDNSAYEFNESLSIKDIMRASAMCSPQEIVLPDVMYNKDATLDAIANALHTMSSDKRNFMAVPQGNTYDEWFDCLMAIINLGDPRITTIGIPRAVDSWNRFRYPMIKMIPSQYQIHLLGWAGGDAAAIPLVIEKLHPGRVRSIDTAKPIHYAMAGLDMDAMFDKSVKQPTRPEDFFTSAWTEGGSIARAVKRNSEVLRGLVACQ